MYEMNQRTSGVLELNYLLIGKTSSCLEETIRALDKQMVKSEITNTSDDLNNDSFDVSLGPRLSMKNETQLFEVFSEFNINCVRFHLGISSDSPMPTPEQLVDHFKENSGWTDFGVLRWPVMLREFLTSETVKHQARQIFNTAEPTEEEMFWTARATGFLHTFGDRHPDLFKIEYHK